MLNDELVTLVVGTCIRTILEGASFWPGIMEVLWGGKFFQESKQFSPRSLNPIRLILESFYHGMETFRYEGFGCSDFPRLYSEDLN